MTFTARKKINTVTEDVLKALPDTRDPTPLDFSNCLKPFITQLPSKYQDILLKTTLEKVSQKDYAKANNLTYAAVKSRVQRARKLLKEKFVACCGIQTDNYGYVIATNNKNCTC